MVTGGCHCGAVRYSIGGEALRSALCACADCRRSAGAPAVSWALFARDAVAIDGDPATYNSSGDVRRSFCGRCGTGLFFESDTRLPDMINVRTATLDDPAKIAPRAWVQMADAPEWLHHIDSLPKFDRYSGR
ncbi:GFA family protein [Mesorhizobium sp. LHD-90]|uniref:GFA family protein n=1 Tax=Mesorhizobium sp. LHD-90 TaxID=3071414 RepID=UPI0027DF3FBE|nr:GFA family protein [Mesorhizobium sp. LHD-90]MDQ6436473.1 GFA family protein [Mesorhizobium sp. LHD-90]